MTKTSYRRKNEAITGMSDDDFYGREEAIGVDLDACKRAAILEAKSGYDTIIHGSGKIGMLRIELARVRLAIVLGNESQAMDYLSSASLPAVWPQTGTPGRKAMGADDDAAEFDRGVNREHQHPGLAGRLAELEEEFAQAKRA